MADVSVNPWENAPVASKDDGNWANFSNAFNAATPMEISDTSDTLPTTVAVGGESETTVPVTSPTER
jgi:hypothetical protein